MRLVVDPASDAHHHPAADQPVSQPDQELLAGGRNRLSRSRLGVFAGTVLNQTNQAVEVILMTMARLSDVLSLLTSRS